MTEAEYLAMVPGYDPGAFLDNLSEAEIREYLNVNQSRRDLEAVFQSHGLTPSGKSFLDVGCGMGGYMLAARDLGMSVRGFEPSPTHARLAAETLKLDIEQTYFTPEAVGDSRFDLILLSHVIEHIYHPGAFIAGLVSVLKPGGVLLMITPNSSSLIARLTGRRWPMLVPIDHVNMMTKQSFEKVAPVGTHLSVRTSEYPEEFAATFSSILKSAVRGAPVNDPNLPHMTAPKLMREVSLRSRVLKGVLAVASLPFYAYARATNNAAALVVTIARK